MAALGAVLLIAALAVGPVAADTKTELRLARARLQVLKVRMEETAARIFVLKQEAERLAGQIHRVQTRITETQAEIDRLRTEIGEAEAEVAATQVQLDQRVRTAFEDGDATALEFALGATSLSDLADRLVLLDAAARKDRELIEEIQALRADLRTRKEAMRRLEANLKRDKADLERRQADILTKLEEAKALMDSLEEDRAEADALLERLAEKLRREKEAKRIRAELLAAQQAALEAARASGPRADGKPGPFYVCPVGDPHTYSNDFGYPRPDGRTHKGNDIFAPYGTPIFAPFDGTAVDASNHLGGISVKVFGAKGYVYNAHLSEIVLLGEVKTGDVIGRVGTTGNAKYTSPHDHFEWHPDDGPAVNPYYVLNEVC